MHFGLMGGVSMIVGSVIARVLVAVVLRVPRMFVAVLVLVHVLVGVEMRMLVSVFRVPVSVLMGMDVGVFVSVSM